MSELTDLARAQDLDINPLPEAVAEAARVIRALPNQASFPELSVEPDGAVAIEWLPSKTRMLSISIKGSGRLVYAWINGAGKGYAVETFRGESLPAVVATLIQEIS